MIDVHTVQVTQTILDVFIRDNYLCQHHTVAASEVFLDPLFKAANNQKLEENTRLACEPRVVLGLRINNLNFVIETGRLVTNG